MAVPFGFSIGDIVATTALVTKVISILADSSRVTLEYEEAIRTLQSLATSMQKVWAILTSSPLGATNKYDKALMNGLRYHTDTCQTILTKFLVKL